MAKLLEMPKLSPTMEEGVLSVWHKKEGDSIGIDDLLAEVETDKATMEFRSFDKGTVLKILVAAGTQVKLGQPVAILGAPGEDISPLLAQLGTPAASTAAGQGRPTANPPNNSSATPALQEEAPRQPLTDHVLERTSHAPEPAPFGRTPEGSGRDMTVSRTPEGSGRDTTGGRDTTVPRTPETEERVLASPYVRKVARDMGIELQGAHGTGKGGRVALADLEAMRGPGATSLARGLPSPAQGAYAVGGPEPELRPLSPMRKTIARRLTESKTTVPHFYLSIDVDAEGLWRLRQQINAELAADAAVKGNGQAGPIKVSLNDLLVKACAVALSNVPECNASFSPDAIILHKRIDISVAVAVPDGLLTPVIRRADQKSVVAIANEIRDLAARARSRKLKPEEMQNGTFSVSNLGMFGVDDFAAVINPPEGAILAVGQVREVPVVTNGAVVPGKRIAMTLSCDHRVIDGAIGAAFLAELRRLLEHPLRVLTG